MNELLDVLNTFQIDQKIMTFVPVLIIIGRFLKNTPKVPDWLITWALFGISLIVSLLLYGINFDAFLNAFVAAASAVMSHQLYKQTKNGIEETTVIMKQNKDTTINNQQPNAAPSECEPTEDENNNG